MTQDGEVRERRTLLGQLTEHFNSAEFLLHWVVWAGMGVNIDSPVPSLLTQRLGARQLVELGKDLCDAGGFGEREDEVRAILSRAKRVIDQRNAYVHSFWSPDASVKDAQGWLRQTVRDTIRSPGENAIRFDVRHLRTTVFGLHQLVLDLAKLVDALHPGLSDERR